MAHGESPRHKRSARKTPQRGKAGASARPRNASAKASKDKGGAQPVSGSTGAVGAPAPVRLQKLLASAGLASRRDAEAFIRDLRVTVNGRTAELGDSATPGVDEIRVDGERLVREKPSYWILHKPRGVVTTVRDDEGRRTVMDLVPPAAGHLFPVGRLDRETSGLILMTNDGDSAHVLLHPSLGNEREYRVSVKGAMDERAVRRLERGVQLEDGRTSPGKVANLRFDGDQGNSTFALTLMEGKKRQIRRSLLILGFPVRRLVRVRMGPLRLGRLPAGEARPLRSDEKRALLDHVARLRAGERPAAPTRPSSSRSSAGTQTRRPAAPRGPAGSKRKGSASSKSAARAGTTPRKKSAKGASKSRKKAGGANRKKASRTRKSAKRSASKPARKSARKTAGKGSKGSGAQRTARSRKGTRK